MIDREKVVSVKDLKIKLDDSNTEINYGSFDIYSGDFIILKGHNGSGKSTFFKLFKNKNSLNDRYFQIEGGELIVHSPKLTQKSVFTYNLKEQQALNRAIVDVGQEDRFESWASGFQAILNSCQRAIENDVTIDKMEKSKLIKDAKNCIEKYFLENNLLKYFNCDWKSFKTKKATSFSGGQQKMIHLMAGVIKAEITGSKLILMDEPLNNLDAHFKGVINDIIKELRKNNLAILVITHCQIFEGINRQFLLREDEEINLTCLDILEEGIMPHYDCLENCNYQKINKI